MAKQPEDKPHRRTRTRLVRAGGPDPVDIHVGTWVKLRRTLLGITQQTLGEALGLTFQQVQKYEKGDNRISASTLHRLSGALDVPVSFFFDDMADDMKGSIAYPPTDTLVRRDSLALLRHYYRISDATAAKSTT